MGLNSEGGAAFQVSFGCHQEGNTDCFLEELVTVLLRNHSVIRLIL